VNKTLFINVHYLVVYSVGVVDYYIKYGVMIKNTNTKDVEFEDTIYDVFNSKSVAGSTKTYTINIDADVYELAYYYIEMKLIDVDSNEEIGKYAKSVLMDI